MAALDEEDSPPPRYTPRTQFHFLKAIRVAEVAAEGWVGNDHVVPAELFLRFTTQRAALLQEKGLDVVTLMQEHVDSRDPAESFVNLNAREAPIGQPSARDVGEEAACSSRRLAHGALDV